MGQEPMSPHVASTLRIPKEVLDAFSEDFRFVHGPIINGIWLDPTLIRNISAIEVLSKQFDIVAVPKGTIRT
jgi:hypothetical protein